MPEIDNTAAGGDRVLRAPGLGAALLPIAILVTLLSTAVYLFGSDSSYGPNQIALLAATAVAMAVGIRNGLSWDDMQAAVVHGVTLATGAVFILLMVGAVIGSWILSGTVPTLIHYGLALIDPRWFYPATCLICALVGLAIGSSWTVAGTIGIALIGVAGGLGLNPAIAAGAIVSGAYFGDKMSPLSDTTNLAPAAAGSELFSHIRHMCWTTLPAFALAVLIFMVVGLRSTTDGAAPPLDELLAALDARYTVNLFLLIPLLVVLFMAWRRVPAVVSLGAGALLGLVFAAIFQPQRMAELGAEPQAGQALQMLAGGWRALYSGYTANSGSVQLDALLNRGGMASMLNTIWLILCAMAFGAAMEKAGLLQRLIVGVLRSVRSGGALVVTTVLTAIGVNVIASDQYIAIVLTGRLYRIEYERMGLDPLNLSRACEDGGTLTSPLVPWNTCGAYMAATLGVSTYHYLPYAFFNWLCPMIAIAMALAGFKLLRREQTSASAA